MDDNKGRYAAGLARLAKWHSSEGFYAFDNPCEAALFSMPVRMQEDEDGTGA